MSSTTIMVTWQSPMIPNGILRFYRVEFTRITDNVVDDITTTNTSVIIGMLEKFTTYQIQVFATTVAEGDGSNIVMVTTDEDSKLLYIIVKIIVYVYTFVIKLLTIGVRNRLSVSI